jgi:hypothetical protein
VVRGGQGGMHPANSYEASLVSVPVGVLVGRSPPLNLAIRTPSVGWRCRDHPARGTVRAFASRPVPTLGAVADQTRISRGAGALKPRRIDLAGPTRAVPSD